MEKSDFKKEATLCYLIHQEEVLLIHKKRGLGAGKFNAPGGKIESGETPTTAVRREVAEETSVEVFDLEKIGELEFFIGGTPEMYIHVFTAAEYEGTPRESDEAEPSWHSIDSLPYDKMWADNERWVPHVLNDEPFKATIKFSDEMELSSCNVTTSPCWKKS